MPSTSENGVARNHPIKVIRTKRKRVDFTVFTLNNQRTIVKILKHYNLYNIHMTDLSKWCRLQVSAPSVGKE